ncbi:C39 family peptidase [Paenisporosarcina sp. OV554]|uniref:C39 family peptidase n=1 Tax=Paenisporosarcina sp. OV554 TaxID=2135694 RepID=UPI001E4F36CD|nr:C39 family peptidase [Paenisporosarcina sp. OV554]
MNSRNGQPIPNYKIYILDSQTGDLVTSAKFNNSGETKIDGLIPGKEYIIKTAYIDDSGQSIENKEEKSYIHESTDTFFGVETYIERKVNYIDVPVVMQYPELPNGCEITSLTAILNSYGIDVSKTIMADRYLPKVAFSTQDGKRFGPNPHIAFAGNPRDLNGGWYVFANPIVKAAEDVIAANKKDLYAENVSGSTREEILSYIDQNIPVVMWVTLDLSPPIKRGGWYIEGTNEFHSSFTNLHAVVLDGWEDGKVHIMNPLKGRVSHSEDVFFDSYEALGSQAVIVKK